MISLITRLPTTFQLPSSPWTKKKPLTELNGLSSIKSSSPWVLGHLFVIGFASYTNVKSAVQVNGFLSGFFPVFRGVRQGCPLSPLLYVLVAETLPCSIRADTSLNGLYLPACMLEMKISQYADDISVVVVDDYSIDRLFGLFKNYSDASGAKLNVSKCHGLWLGPWRNRLDSTVAVNWTAVSIKALGTILGPSIKPEQRWETPLAKITHTISSWSSRLLSLTGKVTVLNNLVLSQLWYLLTVFVLPTSIVNQINRLLGSFIWDNKTPLVARSTLELRRHQGGFGLCNVQLKMAALHAIWVRRMMATDAGKWTFFFRHYLRKAFFRTCFTCFWFSLSFARILAQTSTILPEHSLFLAPCWWMPSF